MTPRFAPISSLILPRLLAAIGAGSVLAATGCGGRTSTRSGEVTNDVGGRDETVANQNTESDHTTAATHATLLPTQPAVPEVPGPPVTPPPVINPPALPMVAPPVPVDPTSNQVDAMDASVDSVAQAEIDAAWFDRSETATVVSGPEGSSNVESTAATGAPEATSEPYMCEFGQLERFCVSPAYMEQQARYGVSEIQLDPPRSDEEVAAGWDANQCMKHEWIATGCCNPALGPGEPQEDGSCCYVACEGACCGRPFVVDGVARVADVVVRRDWQASDRGAQPSLRVEFDAESRRKLAEAWLADAQMEHASIASFNQFSLDLLRLGAPPELVRDSQLAALDEIEHARHAFTVASRLSGVDSGPGQLAVNGFAARSLADAVTAAVVEGCIGETLAAAVVAEQARLCTDAELASELGRIAEDELRHAELAWRFVAWAVKQWGARTSVQAAFEAALARAVEAPTELGLAAALLHGVGRVTPQEWRRAVDHTLAAVIRPAAATLLASDTLRTPLQAACV